MPYRILIPQDVSEAGKTYLRDRGYEIRMGSGISIETLQNEVRDCHGILARTARYPAEVLRAGTQLRVIGRHGVGVDNIDIETATELGIYVTNAPESNAGSVAEHTIGLIIAAARHFVQCDAAFRRGDFEIRNRIIGNDIEGKVLGLIGVGRVGRLVARKAVMGLNMKVCGYDPFIDPAIVPEVEFTDSIEDLLKNADFVSLHIPANEKTMGLIDKARLMMMRPSAYLINVARGGIVRESDLIEILSENRIAGAALDVFAEEPPDPSSQLFKLDNVTVTPHSAALTRECMDRMAVHAAQGIDEVLSGRTPTWPVNKPNAKQTSAGGKE
jgi:D-3-phosphoglycerate dehydrogenase